ncbi:MAG: PaREP1 family protein [Halobacteriota archaeon]
MSSEAYAQKAERLLSLASTLHQNFYEDWLPPETVMDHAEAVKELVLKRKRIL